MVLLIITANLIIREAEILKVFGEFVMISSPIMSEEAFDPLPKISVRVFIRASIVNLIGTKCCVLQFLYSSLGQSTIIEDADNGLLGIYCASCSALSLHHAKYSTS